MSEKTNHGKTTSVNRSENPTPTGRLLLVNESLIGECSRLFLDVFSNSPWNYTWLTPEDVYRYCSDLLITPKFQGFIYEYDGRAIGVCLGVVSDYFATKTYDIKEIFVDRHLQNRGIGSQLLKEIETVLAAQGIDAITLFTQRNIAAFPFYLKNGYIASEETAYLCKPLLLGQ